MRRTLVQSLPWAALLVVGGFAFAQTIDNSGRVFPYAGYLEVDGQPANGLYDVDVALFTQDTGGAACDTLSYTNVSVNAGRFQVLLDGVSDLCFIGTGLWLELAVAPAGNTPTPLVPSGGGRVAMGAVPFAAQGASYTRFFAELLETFQVETDRALVEQDISFLGADGANQLGNKITLWAPTYGVAIQPDELRTYMPPTARMTVGSTTTDGLSNFNENITLYANGDIRANDLVVGGVRYSDSFDIVQVAVNAKGTNQVDFGTQSFTTGSSGRGLLIVSASGYRAGANASFTLDIYVDNVLRGTMTRYVNEGTSHKTLPTQFLPLNLTANSSHSLRVSEGGGASIDTNDQMNAVWIELP